MGLKASDLETIPQCLQCHADWGANSGPFKGWTKPMRREWFSLMVDLTQMMLRERAH